MLFLWNGAKEKKITAPDSVETWAGSDPFSPWNDSLLVVHHNFIILRSYICSPYAR